MAQLLNVHRKDLGGFSVSRVLPNSAKRMVGPFIFMDHMGPADFAPGDGVDVRPHPHIGLATITYMLEGSLLHRDSLGNHLEISPGDINWMTAGKGIVHSERETHEAKGSPHRLSGIQTWVALPEHLAEIDPSFTHVKKSDLPHYNFNGVFLRLLAGEAYGLGAPFRTHSPMFYLDAVVTGAKELARPNPEHECLLHIIWGEVVLGGVTFSAGQRVLLDNEQTLSTTQNSRFLLLGGAHWPQVPHIDWNFVSFSRERIEQAKQMWRAREFPDIPGDDHEFTPLP